MNKANIFAGLITGTLFAFFVNAEMVTKETESASSQLGAARVAQVEFDEGQSSIKPAEKDELKAALNEAKKSGKVAEVKIFSWADQEYPAKGVKAPKSSIQLAEQRSDSLKNMMKKDLGVSEIETYNMAKRPNALQEMLKTGTAKAKAQMETTGAAPTKSEDTGIFGLKGKKSAAVVLVYTE
jgi:hypothetical protein